MIERNEIEAKLIQIFQLVFELPDNTDVSQVRRINLAGWDSLAHVTLVTALESEFGINLDYRDGERITSYQSTLLLLLEKTTNA